MPTISKYTFAAVIALLLSSLHASAQFTRADHPTLRRTLQTIVGEWHATVGVMVSCIEDRDTVTIGNNHRYPMQSVYKFPLALAVLRQVDRKKLSLKQLIHVTKNDLRPNTWSPLRDKFPDGNIDLTLSDLLNYTVSYSDNNACDILFRLMGGTAVVNRYIRGLGIDSMMIAATEEEMSHGWDVQYTNWTRPSDMTVLLDKFHRGKLLSKSSTAFLKKLMTESFNPPNRLKGLLPNGTIVAHKTGTGDTNDSGMTSATNDVGIITLPCGKHLAVSVFVSDTYEKHDTNERMIAEIAMAAYRYFDDFYSDRLPAERSDTLFDSQRKRLIPVQIYTNKKPTVNNHRVAIINPGYGMHNTGYTFIANKLVALGYLVIAIENQLPTDKLIAFEGDIYKLRLPVWEQGVQNILYVTSELKKRYPDRRFDSLVLIGHSNGGDIAMLMATRHPELVANAITLDHRRVPIPRTSNPRILSIRATDFEADPGVLPTPEEQAKYGITVIRLGNNARHIDLRDGGGDVVERKVVQEVVDFLGK